MKRQGKRRLHLGLAVFWGLFGLIGICEYLGWFDVPGMKAKIADSIPILFLISVYANLATEVDTVHGQKDE